MYNNNTKEGKPSYGSFAQRLVRCSYKAVTKVRLFQLLLLDPSATFLMHVEHVVLGSSPRLGRSSQLAQLAERVLAGLVLNE